MTAPPFETEAEKLVLESGRRSLLEMDSVYARHVEAAGKIPTPAGKFRARLFALNFSVAALMQVAGRAGHARTEKVYLALYREALAGLKIPEKAAADLSRDLLKEQMNALHSELQNVGAGQYALAALYERALEESTGPLERIEWKESPASLLGTVVGEKLSEWAGLFTKLKSGPMQVYTSGFKKTGRDAERLNPES